MNFPPTITINQNRQILTLPYVAVVVEAMSPSLLRALFPPTLVLPIVDWPELKLPLVLQLELSLHLLSE
jgi:hypothetical protein